MKACVCLVIFSAVVTAAPMLRLSNSVVTVHAAVGVTAASQTLQAFNAGDGTLSLTVAVTPAIAWLALSVLPPLTCPAYFNSPCNPIQFTFKSAGLAPGSYTARVMLSDPNAIDSPQVVIVTLFVGDPQAIEKYVAPGTTTDVPFPSSTFTGCSSCPLEVSTANGGGWLSVVLAGGGTFYYDQSIQLAPSDSLAPGTYTGNIANFNNTVVQNIPVIMHVTTLPVAVPSSNQMSLRLAQNGPATTYPFLPFISLTNSGMGTLQVTGVSGTGNGVSAYNYNGLAIVTVDPGSLAPGTYSDGLVTIQCNGANCPVEVPVTLEVNPPGPPIVDYQGALDNANFERGGSPGDVMIVKGTQLSLQAPQTASETPLPTTLGGASVLVNGVATPLFYSSFGQIAFQARADTNVGMALVQVVRDSQPGNTVSGNIVQYLPGIVVVTDASYNVVDATHPARAGETLVFWALGLGPTSPAVADGAAAPANPPAVVTAPVSVQFGLEFFYNMTLPSFVGLSPGSVGLYQVVATLPASTPVGTVSASLQGPGGRVSNIVTIGVQ